MSKHRTELSRSSFQRTWLRQVLIWTVTLLPAWWCGTSAQDPGFTDPGTSSASAVPLWQQGVSTWGADNYQATDAATTPTSSASAAPSDSAAPYTVPVDPAIYTNPMMNDVADVGTQGYVSTWAPADELPIDFPIDTAGLTPSGVTLADQSQLSENIGIPSYDLAPESESIAPVGYGGTPTITQKLNAGVGVMQAPLREEAIRWYQYPWRWMTTGWANSIELGLDGSQGNSETLAIQTGAEIKRKTDIDTLAFDFDYRLVNNRSVATEDNGRFNIDYDRLVAGSPWSMFSKFGMEWDEFKAFDLRLNINGGVGYHWMRSDTTTLVTRFGAGASRELGAPIDEWTPEAVFGLEAERQVNKRNKLKAKVDYFPAWEDFADYRVVSDFAWEILLDDADNLSLKLALTDRYDATPQGAEKNDFYYSLLLLVKF